jgi:hypothetical protein
VDAACIELHLGLSDGRGLRCPQFQSPQFAVLAYNGGWCWGLFSKQCIVTPGKGVSSDQGGLDALQLLLMTHTQLFNLSCPSRHLSMMHCGTEDCASGLFLCSDHAVDSWFVLHFAVGSCGCCNFCTRVGLGPQVRPNRDCKGLLMVSCRRATCRCVPVAATKTALRCDELDGELHRGS